MTYPEQNMALWISFIHYQLNFGHFSFYFEDDSFVKYKGDLAKTRRSKKIGNIFFLQAVAYITQKNYRQIVLAIFFSFTTL